MQTYFKRIADWEDICPYLINDKDGQRTKQIRKDHDDAAGRCCEMLREFLRDIRNPTWKLVLQALRKGNYKNLAYEIERDLQKGVIAV